MFAATFWECFIATFQAGASGKVVLTRHQLVELADLLIGELQIERCGISGSGDLKER